MSSKKPLESCFMKESRTDSYVSCWSLTCGPVGINWANLRICLCFANKVMASAHWSEVLKILEHTAAALIANDGNWLHCDKQHGLFRLPCHRILLNPFQKDIPNILSRPRSMRIFVALDLLG